MTTATWTSSVAEFCVGNGEYLDYGCNRRGRTSWWTSTTMVLPTVMVLPFGGEMMTACCARAETAREARTQMIFMVLVVRRSYLLC